MSGCKIYGIATAQGSELSASSVGRGEENVQNSDLDNVSCIPWALQSWSPAAETVRGARWTDCRVKI